MKGDGAAKGEFFGKYSGEAKTGNEGRWMDIPQRWKDAQTCSADVQCLLGWAIRSPNSRKSAMQNVTPC